MTIAVQVPGGAEVVAPPLTTAAFIARVEPDPLDPALWEAVEAGTPYQRLDWVRAYADAFAGPEGFALEVVTLRCRAGRVAALLPLAVGRRHGIRVGAILGGRHANFHLPPADAAAGAALPACLAEIGRRLGVDALLFTNVPRTWNGRKVPLATLGRPSPSSGHELALQGTGEATLTAALSKDARKKLRQKERYLAELGPVRHLVAGTPAEVDAVLAAFFAQKAERFAELGIADPFASPAARTFLRDACVSGLEAGRPAVELHALLAGERVVAAFGAAVDERRCSGMFISFNADPAFARCSPGDLLLARIIEASCRRGRTHFDLGVGEAPYKSRFCPDRVDLVDVAVPISRRGRVYLGAVQDIGAAKRWIKANPVAWKTVMLARRLRAGLRF